MDDKDNKRSRSMTIGLVSKTLGLPVSTIRFYEREFSTYLQVEKTPGGHRRFSSEDVEKLKYIHDRIHVQGKTIREVKNTLLSDKDPVLLRRDLDLLLEVFETLVQQNRKLERALTHLSERLLALEERAEKKRFKLF
ncbi:MAG: MerR family transcriptional regulator [Acidobacteriota bacterium]|jgi:DNA-binding transcriptional MerR regulator